VQEATETVNAVVETVTEVKETVEQTVAAVTGSVTDVKDSVQHTVAAVTGSVENTVANLKQTLDIPQHVRDYPWAMFAGAAAAGFVVGKLLERPQRARSSYASSSMRDPMLTPSEKPQAKHRNGHGGASQKAAKRQSSGSSWWEAIKGHYGKDIDNLKNLAIATLGGVVREAATASAPPALAERVKQVVDGFTHSMGAEPIEGSVLNREENSPAGDKDKDDAKFLARNAPGGNW